MPIYRGLAPLKPYRGDMQPVNIYKGATKIAGWHAATFSGQSPLAVDCDYNVPPDALTIDGKCVQNTTTGKNLCGVIRRGAYLSSNGNYSSNFGAYLCCASLLPTLPNQTLCLSCVDFISKYFVICFYDQNSVFISSLVAQNVSLRIFVTPSNCNFLTWGASSEDNISIPSITARIQLELSSTATAYEPYTGGIPAPSPSYPQPISTITGDVGITGADGASSNTATVAFGSAVCASLPDGTHDSYDAVTGVLTKRVDKVVFDGSADEDWRSQATQITNSYVYYLNTPLTEAKTNSLLLCSAFGSSATSIGYVNNAFISTTGRFNCVTHVSSTLTTLAAFKAWLAANPVTVYYCLATPTTVQLTPHLPVVRTGIKTLSIGADVAPNIAVTVKSMD